MKRCPKCGEEKTLDDFFRNSKARDKRQSYCKKCAIRQSNDLVAKMRLEVIETLGGRCVWHECGIDDQRMLVIDHVNGGGSLRKRTTRNPYGYYKSMRDHLSELQVLCWNHNALKRIENGEHTTRRKESV